MTLEDMYGAWHLISIYAENQAGHQNYYLGKDASGRLSYHRDGYRGLKSNRPKTYAKGN